MPVRFFFDNHVKGAVARGLRRRGVDLITAYEDGAHELADPELLQRSVLLGRVLYTHDDDFLSEAHRWQEDGRVFPGLIYAHQLKLTIGQQIEDLELIAKAGEPEDLDSQIVYLPLR